MATPTGRDLDAELWRLLGCPSNPQLGTVVPRYSSSRDAMAGVEREIGRLGLLGEYVNTLGDVLFAGDVPEHLLIEHLAWFLTAPPELRARAALAVLSEGR